MNTLRVLSFILAVLVLAGCSAAPSGGPKPVENMPPATEVPNNAPVAESTAIDQAPPAFAFTSDELRVMAQSASDDLAKRLSISSGEIYVMEASAVDWSDSSLGCPKPDMMYAQMITPGYRIVLKSGDTLYEYHAGADGIPAYCEAPKPPVSQ